MTLNEWVKELVEQPQKVGQLLTGQLQLAGISALEQRALTETFRRKEVQGEPFKIDIWG
ncbi:competence pheromone ComX [Paenibacillus zanthoxyli]|uniref:competence pheromone ComX n=1 Tax=Paenibacillus zanthoxyli TaxID=369399 RepID=UPI0004BC7BCA|nr:competence pheromone ComX [Paenibacillus zanthoxyli]